MANIIQAAISGNSAALRMLKSYTMNPVLISTELPYVFYIPIEAEHITQHADAQVSEALLYTPGNGDKTMIADNVAPGSWTWQISGYINGLGENIINYLNLGARVHAELLKKAFMAGQRMVFKDMDGTPYKNVVIQSIDISPSADCKNKIPVSLTLKQINVITADEALLGSKAVPLLLAAAEGTAVIVGVAETDKVDDTSEITGA